MPVPDSLTVEVASPDDATLVLRLLGDLDLSSVPVLRASWKTALRPDTTTLVLLDGAGLRFVDSTGVGLLLQLREEIVGRGGRLVLQDPTAPVRRVLQLMGLEGHLEITTGTSAD